MERLKQELGETNTELVVKSKQLREWKFKSMMSQINEKNPNS
jgi:hypothetical protein